MPKRVYAHWEDEASGPDHTMVMPVATGAETVRTKHTRAANLVFFEPSLFLAPPGRLVAERFLIQVGDLLEAFATSYNGKHGHGSLNAQHLQAPSRPKLPPPTPTPWLRTIATAGYQ